LALGVAWAGGPGEPPHEIATKTSAMASGVARRAMVSRRRPRPT
jgi:hypothetical protein